MMTMGLSDRITKHLFSLSHLFGTNVFLRHLLFIFLSLIVICLTGYYFGTFDQSIHIPFLTKDVYPNLFPNDPFFELRKTHYSYFWYIFQPFLKYGVLEVTLFLVHVFSTYLTFWALWRLSQTLFRNTLASLLIVIAFIFPHLGFAAFPFFEFSLLNRTFVLPFLLLSIDFYLQRKYIQSFVLLGVMNNIHALSVNFVAFMFLVDLLFRFFRERFEMKQKAAIFLGGVCFIAASLPVLIWKFGKSPLDLTLRPEWFHAISDSLMYTLFYPLSTLPSVVFLTICGISVFVLYFVMTPFMKMSKSSEIITHFMYAAIFLVGLEVLVSVWLPVTILVQFQIIRIGLFAFLFSYMFFIASLVDALNDESIGKRQFLMQFFSVFLSITVLVPVVVSVFVKYLPKKDRLFAGWATIGTALIVFGVIAWQTQIWRPGIYIGKTPSDWVSVQDWARESTPVDAIFLTPPEKWWLFEPDWRVFSRRSTFVTLDEVLEFAFTPDYLPGWEKRFDLVAPGARGQFNGDLYESKKLTHDAYARLSPESILAIAGTYHLSYVVVEKPKSLPFPLVYENPSFAVYKLSSQFVALKSGQLVDKTRNITYHYR